VRWLLENELVDEINLLTAPVTIGQGTRLFADTWPRPSARSGRHPDHTQRGDDPGLPAQRATGVRNVHREGKLATKLGVEQSGGALLLASKALQKPRKGAFPRGDGAERGGHSCCGLRRRVPKPSRASLAEVGE
jgi:hypothetical protein